MIPSKFFFTSLAFVAAIPVADAASFILPRAVTNTSKAGLAWPNANTVDFKQFQTTGKVSWYYTWSVWPTDSDLEFSPLLWGAKSVTEFNSKISDVLKRTQPKVTAVLGMNEPEIPGQSNMTAQEGVQMWQTHLEPLRQSTGLRFGSPSIAGGPDGKKWLQDFFTLCNGNCTVDFMTTHWYGVDADAFIGFLKDFHGTFQKPIWVTEWACQNYYDVKDQCSEQEVFAFMNKTQTFMDGADFVERYAWFGAMRDMQGVNQYNALMDNKGKITTLGAQYTGANASQISTSGGSGISINQGFSTASSRLMIACAVMIGVQVVFLSF